MVKIVVETGRQLPVHFRHALDDGRLYSNDPVCAEHAPESQLEGRMLQGEACHGCLLIAETGCEQRNDFLDRALAPTGRSPSGARPSPTPPASSPWSTARPQRRDHRHRRRFLSPQGGRGTPEDTPRRAPPPASRKARRPGPRGTVGSVTVDGLHSWHRRRLAEALRGCPLGDVVPLRTAEQ